MANVKLRIEINSDASNEALGQISTDNMEFANTSIKPNADGVFSSFPKLSNATSGINSLTYGQELCFNDSDVLDNIDGFGAGLDDEENPVEVVWGIVNEDKTYNVTLTFTGATGLQNVIVYGDKESKQFPTRAILDGTKEVFSDDYIWSIKFDEPNDTHTIQFTHWNRANYNAVLTVIDVMIQNYEVDIYNGLKSVESKTQYTTQLDDIHFGVSPSDGNTEILDKDKELHDLFVDNIWGNESQNISILVNGNLIESHNIQDISFSNYNNINIELGNELSNLTNTIGLPYIIDSGSIESNPETLGVVYPKLSVYDILKHIFLLAKREDLVNNLDNICRNYITEENGYNINFIRFLQTQYINIPEESEFINLLNDVCNIIQANFIKDKNGEMYFVNGLPTKKDDEDVIHIPKKYQLGKPEISFIPKNQITCVDYEGTEYKRVYTLFKKFPILKNVSDNLYHFSSLDTISSNAKDSLLWESSIINNVNNISTNENFLETIDNWAVLRADVAHDNYTKLINNIGDLSQKSGFIAVFPVSTTTADSSPLTTFESYEEFKSQLSSSSQYTLYGGFLDHNYDKYYRETHTLLFAINLDRVVFPFKIFVATGSVSSSTFGGELTSAKSELKMLKINKRYGNYTSQDKLYTIPQNSLLNESMSTPYKNTNGSLSDFIATNLLINYKNGVKTANLTICCANYYDSNNRLAIDWNKGQIIDVGQIVQIDNDNNGNSFVNNKDGSPIQWRVTGRIFRKSGVPLVDLELQEIIQKRTSLEDYSWEEIKLLSLCGIAEKYFSIGDTKKFKLSTGEMLEAQIIDFNRDYYDTGTPIDNIAGITFMLKYPLKTLYPMNDSTAVYLKSSTMYTTTLPTIYQSMPEDLKSVIKLTRKRLDSGFNRIYSRLWLMSLGELYESDTIYGYPDYDEPYKLFISNPEILRKTNDGLGWWTRTINSNNDGCAFIKDDGTISAVSETNYPINRPNKKKNIVFGFCI